MKRNKELRADARLALKDHWGWAILVCIIFCSICGVLAIPNVISQFSSQAMRSGNFFSPALAATAIGTTLVTSSISLAFGLFGRNPLSVGLFNSFNRYFSNSDYNTVGNLFRLGFGGGHYWRNVLGIFLMNLFVFLWTLLFIIPGIIKAYAYAMTPYILVDNPELGPNEARLKSIEMMRGHKWKLFGLQLSFIGWFLLCLLSLGVGFIWLMPYVRTTYAAFYRNLKEEFDPQPAIAE